MPQARRILGDEHKTTLGIRSGIAHWTGRIGDHARAVDLYEIVAADAGRVLGDDDRLTIACRDSAAYEIGAAGDPRRAADALSALLHDMEAQRQHPRDLWGTRYRVAYWMTEAGNHVDALNLWEYLVTDALASFGRIHLWSLDARAEHADCVGAAGDPSGAAHLLDEIMFDASQLESPPSTNILGIARRHATWTGKAGNPTEAVKQLKYLVGIATEQRGPNDSWTLSLRRHLAHWTGEAGNPLEALRQLEQLAADVISYREISKKVQESLVHWRNRAN